MSWIEKSQPTPFDNLPIPGFFLLDGDFLFMLTREAHYRDTKRPMIAFPSGSNRALWPGRQPEQSAEFYLFGEMALPVWSASDEAFQQAVRLAAAHGYGTARVGEHAFEVWDERDYDHFRVAYDPETGYVADAVPVKTIPKHPQEVHDS